MHGPPLSHPHLLHCEQSKAPSISEGMDMDDDLAVVGGNSSGETNKDPFSMAVLQKDASGKYPIKMPCGHIYNWTTIMGKASNGKWQLATCSGMSPASLPVELKWRCSKHGKFVHHTLVNSFWRLL